MKSFSFSLVFFFLTISSFAQTEVISVGIIPFVDPSGIVEAQNIARLQETVTSELVNTGRFTVEDGEQPTTGFALFGSIVEFRVTDFSKEDGSLEYTASIKLALKVKSCSTGQIISTETLDSETTFGLAKNAMKLMDKAGVNIGGKAGTATNKAKAVTTFSTPEAALNHAFKGIEKTVRRFISKNFTAITTIVEISEIEGNAATSILILTGENSGLTKGAKLDIIAITSINVSGKTYTRKKTVGQIKLIRFEGDFAVCEVKKGGEEIKKKFTGGEHLICVKSKRN